MTKISLELGSGGKLMRDFINREILQTFRNSYLEELADAALLPSNIALTTDSYVVDPLFFPGGDIGTLCINGTVNDLIVSGAKPQFLALSLILEEGLDWTILKKILKSIKKAATEARVLITTGDTKVVRQGQGDKIYITTSGVGEIVARPSLDKIRPGDKIIVTGTLGEHSLAVMLARQEFGLEAEIKSDCAPLNFLLPCWQKGALWMRDITRGGLASVLNELAERLSYPIVINEASIPLSPPVQGACEFLGIDPLYLACEGRAVIVAEAKAAENIFQMLRNHPQGRTAAIIGEITTSPGRPGELLLQTSSGGWRLLEPLTSELLPRIC
ncbi:hydrogenase expression/formation protein HypE [Candidatus Aminicenantes bacterium AC-334-K16]|jgi:hydrogenase expression/formation protein HypE|nr:hydrogenase expression/formation protein HypE [Candidatus Aminicenantes bacterium AC-334-K16]